MLSFDRLERINTLCDTLDSQLTYINKWRAVLSEMLHASLVDQGEEQKEATGSFTLYFVVIAGLLKCLWRLSITHKLFV